MTTSALTSELATLVSESKKKAPEVRAAAEKALQELKALPSTSDAQLGADIRRRPQLLKPFVLACKTRNAKLALPAVNGLHRLVVMGALANDTLPDVLDAFQESTSFGIDVQLKILQSIPSLLQNYSALIQGPFQAALLQICSTLQQTKTAAISRTASATLQQAVSFLFEKLEAEEEKPDGLSLVDLHLGEEIIRSSQTAHDAYQTLQDICLLIEGERPTFVSKASLSPTFGLEILESVLTDHSHIFMAKREQQYLLRHRVVPVVTRILSEKLNFSITVRTTRILCILLREHLDTIKEDCEIPLSLLIHSLETDAGTPWRRALCMEAMRLLFSDANLVLETYALFDEVKDRKSIIQETLASFVRLAAEKPNLLGIGQHSSFPASQSASKVSQEQAAAAAANDAGIIGGDFGVSEVNVPGISSQWSVMRTPCLDLLDKTDPPSIPETYVYSMVLTCVNNLTDALAKIVLPLSVPDRGPTSRIRRELAHEDEDSSSESQETTRKRSNSSSTKYRIKPVPANPLDLIKHPSHASVKTIVELINTCWPAILATSSTFLYAALDADYYRGLIRSFQKLTQVAGLLRLSTPRDAFLTTLAKAAVPAGVLKSDPGSATPISAYGGSPRLGSSSSFQNFSTPESPDISRRNSIDVGGPSLSQRNLMCLRALVNLAIALGPILDQAWSIVLDSIQRASVLLATSGTMAMARDYRSGTSSAENSSAATPQTSLSSEISAVESAVTRMIQSTSEYPNDAFKALLSAICNLIAEAPLGNPESLTIDIPPPSIQRRVSGVSAKGSSAPQYDHFVIAKLGEVARVNLMRLTYDTEEGGWNQLLLKLLGIAASSFYDPTSRLMAADVVGSLTVESAAVTTADAVEARATAQMRSLEALQALIGPTRSQELADEGAVDTTVLDIHKTALDALGAILERCGDAVTTGWEVICTIISSTFKSSAFPDSTPTYEEAAELVSGRLARSAFGSLQLVSSDFLASVPKHCFPTLIDIASRFCAQQADLNLSLTTITICWNITNHVQSLALQDTGESASMLELWLETQRRLIPVTIDNRAEVRNGVIHTIIRIMESAGEHLTPDTWALCMRQILFRLMDENVTMHKSLALQDIEIQNSQTKPWTATSKVIIEAVGRLCGSYLDKMAKTGDVASLWQDLLDRFSSFLEQKSFEISTDAFVALSGMVEAAEEQRDLSDDAIDRLGDLWMNNAPVQGMRGEPRDGEKTMAAYVALQKQLLKLLRPRLQAQHIVAITANLNLCLQAALPTPYTSDVDTVTPLQKETLDSMELLRADIAEAPSIVITTLAKFVTLPYSRSAKTQTGAQLTFVAFAKSAIDRLEAVMIESFQRPEMLTAEALDGCLSALAQTISRKYTWSRQGRGESLWRKATSSAVRILARANEPRILAPIESKTPGLWSHIVAICAAVMYADLKEGPPNDQLLRDESFDLESAAALIQLITPKLCKSKVSRTAQTDYVRSLFRTSLLHPVGVDEVPTQMSDPLHGITTVRRGRTVDSPFNPRVRMCYFCFDQLVELNAGATSAKASALAAVAFPYLVLRAALPLKTYIADQPLRGHMPTPTSQRLEMLYVLDSVARLQCAPEALSASQGKTHVVLLAPLVNRGLEHAGRDGELSAAMRRVLEVALALM